MTADPISDYLFFRRNATGLPLSPYEQMFYWYYLPALAYTVILAAAIILKASGRISPQTFNLIIVAFVGIATIYSVRLLGVTAEVVFLMAVPFILLIYVLFYETVIKTRKGRINL